MRNTPLTAEEIMAFGPCDAWPEERVRGYVGVGIQPENFLDLRDLYDLEFLWLILRREVMTDEEIRNFTVRAALHPDVPDTPEDAAWFTYAALWQDTMAGAWEIVRKSGKPELLARVLRREDA
jgi:hypothetical protein